jgi:hypothetical protein
MLQFLAQAAGPEKSFWNAPNGSQELWLKIGLALAIGVGLILALMGAPARMRRPIVAFVTFISGLYWVLYWLVPQPIDRQDNELPLDGEGLGFWLSDAQPVISTFGQVLSSFLLGLGIYSLLRVHLKRLFRMQKDWFFSLVLLVSLVAMTGFGYADWVSRLGPNAGQYEDMANWKFIQYGRHFLFEGLLQQMDAAMFSVIAFFILSAAYRAFRVRSIEATILLATALIVMLSLMGAVGYLWDEQMLGQQHGFLENFKLAVIAGWLRDAVQTPAIRGIDFGVGIGALAMGLRLWLSLERSAASG